MNTEKNPYGWYIIAAVMLSTVMEILDTTIVTVSLPHMMGSLGADRDQISWVLTSYIVAAGMLMPLTGFLVNRLGSRRLLLINIVGFLFSSALCGISANLTQMVLFRLFQGFFGASLVPLSQFILRETFSSEEQPKVMAIWGIGVMAAPIMGPTLGGYITDTLNWRWIFYINVPVCIINFFLVLTFIKESPIRKQVIDWVGMILLLVFVGSLQLFLDRGEVDGWFSSVAIRWFFSIFIVTFILFIYHGIKNKNSIINIRLFTDRNFAFGTIAMTFFAIAFLSTIMILPQMLQTLFGYTSDLTGLTMAPRGIASGIMMAIGSRLLSKQIDPRILILSGLGISSYTLWLMSDISLDMGNSYITLIGFVQGFGIGAFFLPLSTIVYSTLPKNSIAEASGLFNFGRSIGNAIGISLMTTYLSRDTQSNWNILGGHIQQANSHFQHWLERQHLTLNNPHTIPKLAHELSIQANFVAYLHTFRLAAILLFVAIAMIFFIKISKSKRLEPIEVH
jgi:DHA2 family multidrug resistance protein